MRRTEFKIREVNRKWIEKVLVKNGFKNVFEGQITTIYYDKKEDDFLKMGKRITLRIKGDKAKLSYRDKYNEVGLGVVDEYEVSIGDGDMMDQILVGLGFERFKVFKKHRFDYQHGNVIVSFDQYIGEYEYIPEFMMIESDSEDEVFEWAEKFGYVPEDCEPISVLDLINMYGKKNPDYIPMMNNG